MQPIRQNSISTDFSRYKGICDIEKVSQMLSMSQFNTSLSSALFLASQLGDPWLLYLVKKIIISLFIVSVTNLQLFSG